MPSVFELLFDTYGDHLMQEQAPYFESGNIIQKAKALIPILVPLFISAFRRADELAVAMECRCYHGGEGRTKLHVLQYEGRDYLALALGLAVTAGIIVLRQFT